MNRIAFLPHQIADELFLNTIKEPDIFCIVGVEQTMLGISNAGLFYSLARILDLAPKALAIEIAKAANTPQYYILGNGAGNMFSSGAELANLILQTFVEQKTNCFNGTPHGRTSFWTLLPYATTFTVSFLKINRATSSLRCPPAQYKKFLAHRRR